MTDGQLFHQEVRMVPYQKEWQERYHVLKQLIIGVLGAVEIDCHVHHVGGTAVPGMCSKPIVDILVVVTHEQLMAAKQMLDQVFVSLGECGRPGRFFYSEGDNEHDAAYIHLTTSDHPVAIDQQAFLSLLLASEGLQQQYAEFKMRLAEKYPMDRYGYRKEKGTFIQQCLHEKNQHENEK